MKPAGKLIYKEVSLTCMTNTYTSTAWFKIFKVPCFYLKEVAQGTQEYIDK